MALEVDDFKPIAKNGHEAKDKNLLLNVNDELLQHLSPLGWEHINLTGDYVWRSDERLEKGRFRPLRPLGYE